MTPSERGEHTFSVGELGRVVQDLLTGTFRTDVWVRGEVRNIKRASSGHVYFDLVDPAPEPGRSPEASLSVVLFKGTRDVVNAQIRRAGGGMRIEDGVAIRLRAAPDFYPPQGRVQLRMTGIDPAYTLGMLVAARDRLLRLLAAEDLIERNRRLPLPLAPLRVGLVTAPGSAAQADFVEELRRSRIAFSVIVAGTTVQGTGAAARVVAAIATCVRARVDVIAVVRGGGARTDLATFDDESVARAVATCPVPVLTGIGHEIDTSVADEVAHLAVKTPTACAAVLVDRVCGTERRALEAWGGIVALATRHTDAADRRLTATATVIGERVRTRLREADARTVADARHVRAVARARLARAEQRLLGHGRSAALSAMYGLRHAGDDLERNRDRVHRSGRRRIQHASGGLDAIETRVRLLDPAVALARGWSITTTGAGTVVRSVADLSPGATLRTRVADGVVTSTVDGTTTPVIEEADG